jgi:hypothetical protein
LGKKRAYRGFRGASGAARCRTLVVCAVSLLSASAPAAYFHESRPPGMLWLSDVGLKRAFVVQAPVTTGVLGPIETGEILRAPPSPGLFERQDGPKIPEDKCQGDDAKIRRCEREWESTRLAQGKSVASRSASTLTLKPKKGTNIVLADWENCSSQGECDGERFLYLGPLGRSAYQAVEIEYEHDSASLVLFDANNGKVVAVHYGSEQTSLNPAETLLVSAEDLNDATTLLVTRLGVDEPAIDVHCLGARTESSSFGVTFKRWVSDSSFDVVLVKAGRNIPARFERSDEGVWAIHSQGTLKSEGFECRQRGTGHS